MRSLNSQVMNPLGDIAAPRSSPTSSFSATSSEILRPDLLSCTLGIRLSALLLALILIAFAAPSQTSWTRHPANPVLNTGGGPNDWDRAWVLSPSVILKDSSYVMWYSGDDGTVYQTGRATSPDGVTWSKDPLNPVLRAGLPSAWDRSGAWEAKVILSGNQFSMAYTGADARFGPGSTWRIGRATSSDGRSWVRDALNPLLKEGDPNSWESFCTNAPTILFDGSMYHLWYEAHRGSWFTYAEAGIGHATSEDGIHWTKQAENPVLTAGPPGSWDELGVGQPHVIYDSGFFHMWYAGNEQLDLDVISGIGYAVSTDGTHWKKYPANPVLVGVPGSWEPRIFMPCVVARESSFQLWYTGGSSLEAKSIGHANAPRNHATITLDTKAVQFGNVPPATLSDTAHVVVSNWGFKSLLINSITAAHPEIILTGRPPFPATIPPFTELQIGVVFRPTQAGVAIEDSIVIVSNDSLHPITTVPLRGRGSGSIVAARPGLIYGISATQNDTQLYEVDRQTGSAGFLAQITPDPPREIHGFTIRPLDRMMYAARTQPLTTTLYRISPELGDIEEAGTLPVGEVSALAFSRDDALYIADNRGGLYRTTGLGQDTVFIGRTSAVFTGLAFNPVTGDLWGCAHDSLFVIDPNSGSSSLIGSNGGALRSSIAFGPLGTLYGSFGTTLVTIDRASGGATVVGSTGVIEPIAIAMRGDLITGADDPGANILGSYQLHQNYPNPSNPLTTIQYELPRSAEVRLSVYDMLGREVSVVVNEREEAGVHEVRFDGSGLASGVYIYRLQAGDFVQMRKLLLLK